MGNIKYYYGKNKVKIVKLLDAGQIKVELLEKADLKLMNVSVGTHVFKCEVGFQFITDADSLTNDFIPDPPVPPLRAHDYQTNESQPIGEKKA